MICYPESHRFSSQPTLFVQIKILIGISKFIAITDEINFQKAGILNFTAMVANTKIKVENHMKRLWIKHRNLSVCDSGLRIHLEWPHMGATPDGVITCNCCGLVRLR